MDYSRVVRFGETDAGGVVYFAELLKFCHEAYEAGLGAAGIDLKTFFASRGTTAVPIVRAQADFYGPMFCGDRITIALQPKLLTPDSFEISYEILGQPKAGAIAPKLAQALTRHVCIRTKDRHRCPLPERLMGWVQSDRLSDASDRI